VSLRAVFVDAGNTIVALDYARITVRLRADSHDVEEAAVRAAEARARVRLDPHLAAARGTEAPDVFALYLRYIMEGLGLAWSECAVRVAADLRSVEPFGLWSVPIPEAPAALDDLRRLGLRLVVVSNSNGTVARLLETIGLAGHVDAIVDSAVVGAEKPDPRIFRHAADLVGVRPEEAVHVGDLYSVDVLGARGAGCQAILIDPVGAWVGVDCPTAVDIQSAGDLIARML
jgi:HAD superfamily hydrolase (TIGR01509 family)